MIGDHIGECIAPPLLRVNTLLGLSQYRKKILLHSNLFACPVSKTTQKFARPVRKQMRYLDVQYVSFIGLRLTKTSLTLINRIKTKQKFGCPKKKQKKQHQSIIALCARTKDRGSFFLKKCRQNSKMVDFGQIELVRRPWLGAGAMGGGCAQ